MGKKISRRPKLKKISYAEPSIEKTSHIYAMVKSLCKMVILPCVVSEEFQPSLRIRRKALPLSSAKDDLQQYLQP